MQGRPAGRAGGGAGMRRRTAGNVERGRRTVRPGDEAAATATWAAGVGVGTITACWRRRGAPGAAVDDDDGGGGAATEEGARAWARATGRRRPAARAS